MKRCTWVWHLVVLLSVNVTLVPAAAAVDAVHTEVPVSVQTFDAVWQTIHETHFDPDFNGIDWVGVRDELRPRAFEASEPYALRALLWQMLLRLGQSHFGVIPKETSADPNVDIDVRLADEMLSPIPNHIVEPNPGLQLRKIDGQFVLYDVFEHSPADLAGIQRGWILKAIDGRPIEDSFRTLNSTLGKHFPPRFIEERADFLGWVFLGKRLAGRKGSQVEVTFDTGSAERSFSLRRHELYRRTAKLGQVLELPIRVTRRWVSRRNRIALIRIDSWVTPVIDEVGKALLELRGARGLIIDLRGNLGGVGQAAQGVGGYFFAEEHRWGFMKGRDFEIPLDVTPRTQRIAGRRVPTFRGPIVILIDGLSGSTSEIFTAGMQDLGRAYVIGTASAGAALPSQITELPNGDHLLHATMDYIRESGGRLEGRPIQPDLNVELKQQDLLRRRDAALRQAVRWIRSQLASRSGR